MISYFIFLGVSNYLFNFKNKIQLLIHPRLVKISSIHSHTPDICSFSDIENISSLDVYCLGHVVTASISS